MRPSQRPRGSWLNDVNWPKVVLLGVPTLIVILIVTRLVAPETAEWILAWLMNLTTSGVDVVRNIFGGGSP